ncbi:MAG: thiamine biosynthesis protein ApbE [Proteobacteria bacterium]|nr:MAG: thiamine biosynthesis protein ApbE [Pseudomonadota bacterium]
MGTSWSVATVTAPGTDTGRLEAIVTEALDLVIAQMSPWQSGSDISRFNAAEAGAAATLPSEFHHVLQCALRIAAETGGAYDPTLGALVDLWGFGPQPAATLPPAQRDVEKALRACGWQRLTLSPGGILCQPGGLRLDLSSIAKGFAVDLVAARLHAHGFSHVLVEIGGELVGRGVKPDGTPWWVGIDHRGGSSLSLASGIAVALHDIAIATSGIERAVVLDGRRHAHTIDPATGAPAHSDVVRTTVLAPSCMEADAYATAFMVMGAERSLAFAAARHIAAVLIDDVGREHISPTLAAMLE